MAENELIFPLREITKRIEGKRIEKGKEKLYLQDIQHHGETLLTNIDAIGEAIKEDEKKLKFNQENSVLHLPVFDESFSEIKLRIESNRKTIINLLTILARFFQHEVNKMVDYREVMESIQQTQELPIIEPEILEQQETAEQQEPVEHQDQTITR